MPLYEYQCEKCGRFERIVKFSDPPLAECPTCGGPVAKLFSSPAIQFKGSGFYITDYAKKSSPESSGTKSSATDKSSDKAGSADKPSGEKSEGSSSDSSSAATPTAAATTTKD